MRAAVLLIAIVSLSLISLSAYQSNSAPAFGGAYHLVAPRRAVGAGERVELRLEPPLPAGVRVSWTVEGLGNHMMSSLGLPVYRAPYVIAPGTPPVRVTAYFSDQGAKLSASTEIELLPSGFPGADDCLGPGQAFSKVWGDIELIGNFYVDQLPDLTHRVDPVYPRSDLVRGIQDTVYVNALVCKSGRVLDVYPVRRYGDRNALEPIDDDPKLVDAAVAAVRQDTFTPALSSGQPVAVWVAVPVIFRP